MLRLLCIVCHPPAAPIVGLLGFPAHAGGLADVVCIIGPSRRNKSSAARMCPNPIAS